MNDLRMRTPAHICGAREEIVCTKRAAHTFLLAVYAPSHCFA